MAIVDYLKQFVNRNHSYVANNSIQWYGNEYGGFFLDQALLSASSNLLSFGIGEDISFDLAVSKTGIKDIFLFDPTPKSIDYIHKISLPVNFHFYPFGISDQDEYADFFLPKNNNHVSGSLFIHKQLNPENLIKVQMKKLFTIIKELQIQQVDILKIDIEGSEYKVLKNIMFEKIHPAQICVEFHNNFYKNGKALFKEVLNVLKENYYKTGAISKSGNEFLFIRK